MFLRVAEKLARFFFLFYLQMPQHTQSRKSKNKHDNKTLHFLNHASFYILMKTEFSWQISENTHMSNVMKVCPVGSEFFMQMDGWTDGQTWLS